MDWHRGMARHFVAFALALATLGSSPSLPLGVSAQAADTCPVWSTYEEASGKTQVLTAFACASTPDDSSVLGLQCVKKRPVLRYYPGNGTQLTLNSNIALAVSLAVGEQGVSKTMRYDKTVGVFSVPISRNEVLLQMLQSGGPLDLTSTALGTHRFRLLGSTKAIAAVMSDCGLKSYIGPPPSPIEGAAG